MADSLLRQLVMLGRIPTAPRKISTAELRQYLASDGFQVDIRSLQRDLITLSRRFALMNDTRTKPFGWSWRPDARPLSVPGMAPSTALALKLAQATLEPILPRTVYKNLGPQFETADGVLKSLSNTALREWIRNVRVIPEGLPRLSPKVDKEVLAVVQQALLTGKRFEVNYRSRGKSSGQAVRQEISPLGLVVRSPVIYLVATAFEYPDVRHYVIHRMSGVALLDKPAFRPKDFDLETHIASQEFNYPLGKKIRLDALFEPVAAFHLSETPLSTDQKMNNHRGNRVRVRASVQDTAQLRWWLLAFGSQVEVLGPKRLRDEFRRNAGDLATLYGARSRH